MLTKPGNNDLEKLRDEIALKNSSYLKLQNKINGATGNPDRFSDKRDMRRLLKQRAELLRLSTELNSLIKQSPTNFELIDTVVLLLSQVGETLQNKPVKKERLKYTYETDHYPTGHDEQNGEYGAGSTTHSKKVLDSHGKKANNKMAEEGAAFLKDVEKNTRQQAVAAFQEQDATKAYQTTKMLDTYSVEENLQKKYNQSKPRLSGFPLGGFKNSLEKGRLTVNVPPIIDGIRQDLGAINADKPMKPDGTVDHELLASRIRGCLLQHKATTSDNTAKKMLTGLLNEPGIKRSSSKADNKKDVEAFKASTAEPAPPENTPDKDKAKKSPGH